MTAIPGRLTPGKVRIRNCAAATQAPVFPALIATSASCRATILHMIPMELFGLARTASTGDSSMSIVSVVWTV